MKAIFLDHDGVMCLSNNWGGRYKKSKKWHKTNPPTPTSEMPVWYRFDNFDKKAVDVLNEILQETGAEIVISSDWKLHCTLDEMKELFTEYGISKVPIDFTPNLRDFDESAAGLFAWKGWLERSRVLEIRKWLENHPEVTHWVAVDDLNMGREGLENFVLCERSNEGIKQSGLKKKIIEFLNEPERRD
jgi:hypothetical protein